MPEAGVPRAGLIRVGEVFITNVLPVPVCEAMAVELPTLVIGPVRFALVVTVAALPVVELELPVILPTMGLVTVRFVRVPTLVKLDPVTVDFRLVPINVPASAGTVIFPVPSKATPFIFLAVANLVAVPALPVMLPVIGLVTVKLVKVPTLVKLDPVTVDFKVVPVNCSAATAAEILMSPLPSNATPFIFLAVANLVAVPALPETEV
jgi:hypothetical protein